MWWIAQTSQKYVLPHLPNAIFPPDEYAPYKDNFATGPGARFWKAPETFRTRKAIFRSSVCKNGEVYTPETSCMKWISVHIKNMWIKQLCNRKFRDFALALRARKVSGAFEKRATGMHSRPPWLRSFWCWPKGAQPLGTECRKRSWECTKSLLTSDSVVEM